MPELRDEDMAIRRTPLGMDVVEAARRRIKNLFSNGVKIYLSTSGGKDSIVLCDLVYRLCESGEVDKSLLTVVFVDEEVIYDDVIRICQNWRRRFMMIGVPYVWYCVEHKNNNCFNALENNETFIPWDRFERKNWSHEMPPYAIETNANMRPRKDTYQEFLMRNNADGITIVGVRTAESFRRLDYVSKVNRHDGCVTGNNVAYPIYDWSDGDVWKYIKDNDIDFPDVYLRMYEGGIPKNRLRVCNFFAIDTCGSLPVMAEVYPDLWDKVLRREPNAYLVRLYWDTEMFRRRTERRKALEGDSDDAKDYKALVMDMVKNPTKYFNNPHTLAVVADYRKHIVLKFGAIMDDKDWKRAYEGMITGDTKRRTFSALHRNLANKQADQEQA